MLAEGNDIFTNETYYKIEKLKITFLSGLVSCSYKGLNIFKEDNKANTILSTIHRITQQKNQKIKVNIINEILYIIHNDKETKQNNK